MADDDLPDEERQLLGNMLTLEVEAGRSHCRRGSSG
jgi:hypothetical protein